MANGVARGRDEERERRTEDTRDRKIDIGTRSVRASEKGAVGARGWAAVVRGGSARKRRRGKRKARARTEYIDRGTIVVLESVRGRMGRGTETETVVGNSNGRNGAV